jgi:hypothetical protein
MPLTYQRKEVVNRRGQVSEETLLKAAQRIQAGEIERGRQKDIMGSLIEIYVVE